MGEKFTNMKVGTEGSRKACCPKTVLLGTFILLFVDDLPWIPHDSTILSWTLGWVPSMLTSLKWPWHNRKRWLVTCDAKFHGLWLSPVWILYQRFVLSTDSPLSVITCKTVGDCNSPGPLGQNYDVTLCENWTSTGGMDAMVLFSNSTLLNTRSLDAQRLNEPISIAMTGTLCWFPDHTNQATSWFLVGVG